MPISLCAQRIALATGTAALWLSQICDWGINYLGCSQWQISLKFETFAPFLRGRRGRPNLQEDADWRTRSRRRARWEKNWHPSSFLTKKLLWMRQSAGLHEWRGHVMRPDERHSYMESIGFQQQRFIPFIQPQLPSRGIHLTILKQNCAQTLWKVHSAFISFLARSHKLQGACKFADTRKPP